MSLFGSMFDEDPFFSHRNQMRQMEQMMMGSFMDPFDSMFGNMGFPRLMQPPNSENHPGNPRREGNAMIPFGFGHDFGFPNMRALIPNMDRMADDPNCHSYSSSSVFTYSTGEDGTPKMYQSSMSTRRAPGGIKETRKTVCDSEAGVKKMAIGHHLGEKAHIVEKTKYMGSGQEEHEEQFINLAEEEAPTFNRNWQANIQTPLLPPLPAHPDRMRRSDVEPQRALPSTSRKRDNDDDQGGDKSRRKSHKYKSNKGKHDRDV